MSPTQFRTHWKDSMINEIHPEFQKRFHSREELDRFKKEKGLKESGSVSKQHVKRVKDFVAYCKDEKRKHGSNWKPKDDYPR